MCLATLWKSFALCHVVSAARPPSPRRWSCWEAAGLGEGLGCAPCTSSVFLARAPPDRGPARAVIEQKLPGCAPARGTQPPPRPRCSGGALRRGEPRQGPGGGGRAPTAVPWVGWGGEGCTHGCSHNSAVERATGVAGQHPEPGGWHRGVGDMGPLRSHILSPAGTGGREHLSSRVVLLSVSLALMAIKSVSYLLLLVCLLMLFYVCKILAGERYLLWCCWAQHWHCPGHPDPPPPLLPLGKRWLQGWGGGQRRMDARQGTTFGGLVFFFFPSRTEAGSPELGRPHTCRCFPIPWEDRGCSSKARRSRRRQNTA